MRCKVCRLANTSSGESGIIASLQDVYVDIIETIEYKCHAALNDLEIGLIAYKFHKKWSDSSSRNWQFKRVFTNQYSRVTLTSKDDQLEFVSVIENMI